MLKLPRAVHEDVLEHAREGMPLEVCGILAGKRSNGATEIFRNYRCANVHPEPRTRYLIDPKEQLRVTLEVEDELGLEIVGFYHSHPRGAPALSATDLARARDSSWPGASYLLVWYPGQPEEGAGSWTWSDLSETFDPETLQVEEGEPVPPPPSGLAQEFLVDVAGGRVHRREALTPACEDEITWAEARYAPDRGKAAMILKTRHYAPCPRCFEEGAGA